MLDDLGECQNSFVVERLVIPLTQEEMSRSSALGIGLRQIGCVLVEGKYHVAGYEAYTCIWMGVTVVQEVFDLVLEICCCLGLSCGNGA